LTNAIENNMLRDFVICTISDLGDMAILFIYLRERNASFPIATGLFMGRDYVNCIINIGIGMEIL